MSYNARDEVQTVITTVDRNNRGEKIRVTKIEKESNNTTFLDIRTMYTTEDGEIRPTTKGVRMNMEIAHEIVAAMVEALGDEGKEDLRHKLGL